MIEFLQGMPVGRGSIPANAGSRRWRAPLLNNSSDKVKLAGQTSCQPRELSGRVIFQGTAGRDRRP